MIGIYKITNIINGKIYIGQSLDIKRRWRAEKVDSQSKIGKAIQKYGVENFTFEILENCSANLLNEREKFYIEYYNSFRLGYNETRGGQGHSSFLKLNDEKLNTIIKLLRESEMTNQDIANLVGVCEKTVSMINTGKTWHDAKINYPIRANFAPNHCVDCGIRIYKIATRCEKCSQIAQRVVERPEKETLIQELKNSNFVAVGRKYGVSDNAIRNWCKKYGLSAKSKDYK